MASFLQLNERMRFVVTSRVYASTFRTVTSLLSAYTKNNPWCTDLWVRFDLLRAPMLESSLYELLCHTPTTCDVHAFNTSWCCVPLTAIRSINIKCDTTNPNGYNVDVTSCFNLRSLRCSCTLIRGCMVLPETPEIMMHMGNSGGITSLDSHFYISCYPEFRVTCHRGLKSLSISMLNGGFVEIRNIESSLLEEIRLDNVLITSSLLKCLFACGSSIRSLGFSRMHLTAEVYTWIEGLPCLAQLEFFDVPNQIEFAPPRALRRIRTNDVLSEVPSPNGVSERFCIRQRSDKRSGIIFYGTDVNKRARSVKHGVGCFCEYEHHTVEYCRWWANRNVTCVH